MFCRKCGGKLTTVAKFCDRCGEQVVLVEQQNDKEETVDLKNPYVTPALALALIAFTLGMFPYPPTWEIGTSLPMRIIILGLAMLSSYHSRKARQVNRMYHLQHQRQVKPGLVKIATVLSAITAMVALFTLFIIE